MITIITPVHKSSAQYLQEAYVSLQRQTVQNWTWLLLENNFGKVPDELVSDARVHVIESLGEVGIGALKRRCALESQGDHILELDADDLLAPNAIERVEEAFEHGADMVYSDSASFMPGWKSSWNDYPYSTSYGWSSYETSYDGHKLIAMRAPPATEQNVRLVYWAPDHLRAWSRESYIEVGGHDRTMQVADDHDLTVRYVLAGKKLVHVPECLYFYRVHGNNTVTTKNAEIQDGTWAVYNRNITALSETFAKRNNLGLLDLCGAHGSPAGYTPIDVEPVTNGIQCDLDGRWAVSDSSVGLIRASDAVEHLKDPVNTMNEAWRVLAPGGFFLIDVPSTNGLGAFCDPTHVSFWNKLSFRYYTNVDFARYVPKFKGKFQALRIIEHFPSKWHKRENVPYVQAHLVALKPGYVPIGEVLWPNRGVHQLFRCTTHADQRQDEGTKDVLFRACASTKSARRHTHR